MPFERCYGCRLTWPAEKLEGGLCRACRGLGPEPSQEDYCAGCAHLGACNVFLAEGEVCGDRREAGTTAYSDMTTGAEMEADIVAGLPDAGPLFGGRS
jgi:hypothetical protein